MEATVRDSHETKQNVFTTASGKETGEQAGQPTKAGSRRQNQFLLVASSKGKLKSSRTPLLKKSTRKLEAQRQENAKELQFRVTLASGLQGDDIPLAQQPQWAHLMIHAAGVIQRSWRRLKQKQQWKEMMQKVQEAETSYNDAWEAAPPPGEEDEAEETMEPEKPDATESDVEEAEGLMESSDNDELEGHDPEAVLGAQQAPLSASELPEMVSASPSPTPPSEPEPPPVASTPQPEEPQKPNPLSPPPLPPPPPEEPPEELAATVPSPAHGSKLAATASPKTQKAPERKTVVEKCLPKRIQPKKAPPPKRATQTADVKSATDELLAKRRARVSHLIPTVTKEQASSRRKVSICTTQPPLRPAGGLITTKDPASLGLASTRLMGMPQVSNKLQVPPLALPPQISTHKLKLPPTASQRRLKAIRALIVKCSDGIQRSLAASESRPVSMKEVAKWSIFVRWRLASVKALIREELFGTSSRGLLQSNAAHQLLTMRTSMMTRVLPLMRSQKSPTLDDSVFDASARELMSVGLLLGVVAHDIASPPERDQPKQMRFSMAKEAMARPVDCRLHLPSVSSLPGVGSLQIAGPYNGPMSARYDAREDEVNMSGIKCPKILMQAYIHGNLLDRMGERRQRCSLPPVALSRRQGALAPGPYDRNHASSCPESNQSAEGRHMKVKGKVVSSTTGCPSRTESRGANRFARRGGHLPKLDYRTVMRPGNGPCFKPLELLASPRALPQLQDKDRPAVLATSGPQENLQPCAGVKA